MIKLIYLACMILVFIVELIIISFIVVGLVVVYQVLVSIINYTSLRATRLKKRDKTNDINELKSNKEVVDIFYRAQWIPFLKNFQGHEVKLI